MEDRLQKIPNSKLESKTPTFESKNLNTQRHYSFSKSSPHQSTQKKQSNDHKSSLKKVVEKRRQLTKAKRNKGKFIKQETPDPVVLFDIKNKKYL